MSDPTPPDRPKRKPGRGHDAPPISQEDIDAVRRLHQLGHTRNDIARLIGRSSSTVSKIARQLGLTFVRGPQVAAATEARRQDARARRAQLAHQLLVDAERLRQQMWEQTIVYKFGGKDNTFNSTVIPEPDFAGKRDLAQAIGVLVDRHIRIDEYDRDQDGGDAKSVITDLMSALKAAWEAAHPPQQ